MDDNLQLSSGLYGPLIVLEPGETFDPATDRVMLLSVGGPDENAPVLLNGSAQPAPIELRAGVKYRFRFINISPDDPQLQVSLLEADSKPMSWRLVSKDGAARPAAQATLRAAEQMISVGETYDFEFQAASAGDLRLRIYQPKSPFRPECNIVVPVHVR